MESTKVITPRMKGSPRIGYLVVLPESVSVIAEDAFEGTENVLLLCPGKNDCVRDWAAAHGMIVIGE